MPTVDRKWGMGKQNSGGRTMPVCYYQRIRLRSSTRRMLLRAAFAIAQTRTLLLYQQTTYQNDPNQLVWSSHLLGIGKELRKLSISQPHLKLPLPPRGTRAPFLHFRLFNARSDLFLDPLCHLHIPLPWILYPCSTSPLELPRLQLRHLPRPAAPPQSHQ